MITNAYIHEYGNGKLEPEHFDVKTVLESRGVNCELFTTKRLSRNQLTFNESTLVVGNHPIIETVFKRLKYINCTNSYPIVLRPYLKRNIWESSIRKILIQSHNKDSLNVFIKPKNRTKLFTGFVLKSNQDLFKLESIPKNTDLYCSTVVEWLSEYRVFINNSKIVGIKNYEGDTNLTLDMKEVESAISAFEQSEDRTSAYSLDFGILIDGSTALIEWNDGFALGSYGLDKEVYTDLILSRWNEILKNVFDHKS